MQTIIDSTTNSFWNTFHCSCQKFTFQKSFFLDVRRFIFWNFITPTSTKFIKLKNEVKCFLYVHPIREIYIYKYTYYSIIKITLRIGSLCFGFGYWTFWLFCQPNKPAAKCLAISSVLCIAVYFNYKWNN